MVEFSDLVVQLTQYTVIELYLIWFYGTTQI